jgi:ABC-type branched-subunit amino acid transport system substrate-binding protein
LRDFEDDKCDPKQAVAAFQKLVEQDGVRIIFGPSCSSCSLAVAPLAEKKKVLMVAFSEAASISRFGCLLPCRWNQHIQGPCRNALTCRYFGSTLNTQIF